MPGDCKKIESYKLKTDKINPPNTSGVVLYFLAAEIIISIGKNIIVISVLITGVASFKYQLF